MRRTLTLIVLLITFFLVPGKEILWENTSLDENMKTVQIPLIKTSSLNRGLPLHHRDVNTSVEAKIYKMCNISPEEYSDVRVLEHTNWLFFIFTTHHTENNDSRIVFNHSLFAAHKKGESIHRSDAHETKNFLEKLDPLFLKEFEVCNQYPDAQVYFQLPLPEGETAHLSIERRNGKELPCAKTLKPGINEDVTPFYREESVPQRVFIIRRKDGYKGRYELPDEVHEFGIVDTTLTGQWNDEDSVKYQVHALRREGELLHMGDSLNARLKDPRFLQTSLVGLDYLIKDGEKHFAGVAYTPPAEMTFLSHEIPFSPVTTTDRVLPEIDKDQVAICFLLQKEHLTPLPTLRENVSLVEEILFDLKPDKKLHYRFFVSGKKEARIFSSFAEFLEEDTSFDIIHLLPEHEPHLGSSLTEIYNEEFLPLMKKTLLTEELEKYAEDKDNNQINREELSEEEKQEKKKELWKEYLQKIDDSITFFIADKDGNTGYVDKHFPLSFAMMDREQYARRMTCIYQEHLEETTSPPRIPSSFPQHAFRITATPTTFPLYQSETISLILFPSINPRFRAEENEEKLRQLLSYLKKNHSDKKIHFHYMGSEPLSEEYYHIQNIIGTKDKFIFHVGSLIASTDFWEYFRTRPYFGRDRNLDTVYILNDEGDLLYANTVPADTRDYRFLDNAFSEPCSEESPLLTSPENVLRETRYLIYYMRTDTPPYKYIGFNDKGKATPIEAHHFCNRIYQQVVRDDKSRGIYFLQHYTLNSEPKTDILYYDLQTGMMCSMGTHDRYINDLTSVPGKMVAFDGIVENSQIYVYDDDSNIPIKLSAPGSNWFPVYSSYSDSIIVASSRKGSFDLWQIKDYEGDNPRWEQLTFDGDTIENITISPNGKKVMYQQKIDGQYDIIIFNLETKTAENITQNPSMNAMPAFSLNGSSIIFVKKGSEEGQHIPVVMDLQSSEKTILDDFGEKQYFYPVILR